MEITNTQWRYSELVFTSLKDNETRFTESNIKKAIFNTIKLAHFLDNNDINNIIKLVRYKKNTNKKIVEQIKSPAVSLEILALQGQVKRLAIQISETDCEKSRSHFAMKKNDLKKIANQLLSLHNSVIVYNNKYGKTF